jgi:hypothetical protein
MPPTRQFTNPLLGEQLVTTQYESVGLWRHEDIDARTALPLPVLGAVVGGIVVHMVAAKGPASIGQHAAPASRHVAISDWVGNGA